MKLVLVNQRCGDSRTIVIKGWLKGLLSLCLLGAPVAMGLGYQLALADESSHLVASEEHGPRDPGGSDHADSLAPDWNETTPARAYGAAAAWVSGTDAGSTSAQVLSDSWRPAWAAQWYHRWQIDLLTGTFVAMMSPGGVELLTAFQLPEWRPDTIHVTDLPSPALALAAALPTATPAPVQGAYPHGRLIDPASYVRRTYR